MKFSELKFEPHQNDGLGYKTQARVTFKNGYGASVITGDKAYTNDTCPYELAVLKYNVLCYDTEITNDVIGYLNEIEVESLLLEIEKL